MGIRNYATEANKKNNNKYKENGMNENEWVMKEEQV